MQGRELRAADIDLIQGLLAEHPDWGRTRLSEALCRRWDWRNAQGRFKDMAAFPHAAAEVGTWRPHPTAEAPATFVQRVAEPPGAPGGSCDRTDP